MHYSLGLRLLGFQLLGFYCKSYGVLGRPVQAPGARESRGRLPGVQLVALFGGFPKIGGPNIVP